MAAKNFKPKASSNVIEGATPVDTGVTPYVEDTQVEGAPQTVEEAEAETTDAGENPETAPSVTFEDKSTKQPVTKNVKVCLKTNHSCVIGGVTYHFEKGKQTNVPSNVKEILLQADLLMPL